MYRPRPLVSGCVCALLLAGTLFAADLRITLPKRSKPTPVQKLNQDGVAAVKKHQYEKAKKLFYRAYLLDPDDPFTLNNLGYIAELEGNLDRAQRFYDLAAQQRSDATVVKATSKAVEGKAVSDVAGRAEDAAMNINRYNVQALSLLQKDRAPEADVLLQKALALDARNPFTLNNLGFAREKEGEYEQALNFYSRAANVNSSEAIVISADPSWRGKPISEIAERNVEKLRRLMDRAETPEMRVARLNLQGVSAMNRNEHATARADFLRAYKIDPDNAFTLNNMGYLAELDGDRETADFYYARAAEAKGSGTKVALATRRDVEGQRIGQVATVGDTKVNERIELEREAREREGGPIQLKRRDNSPVVEPDKPPAPLPDEEQAPAPKNNAVQSNPGQVMQPLPENQQPAVAQPAQPEAGQQGIAAPAQQIPQPIQPPAQPAQPGTGEPQQPPQPRQGQMDNGLMMPLPDNQQPGQNPQQQPAAPAQAPQQATPHPQVQQGPVDNGLIMPIPDQQQPSSGVQPSGMPSAPAQAQPDNGGLIMPLPDSQQPPAAQTTTPAPQKNQAPPKKTDTKNKPVKKVIINN